MSDVVIYVGLHTFVVFILLFKKNTLRSGLIIITTLFQLSYSFVLDGNIMVNRERVRLVAQPDACPQRLTKADDTTLVRIYDKSAERGVF
jgi:hypothetical protein